MTSPPNAVHLDGLSFPRLSARTQSFRLGVPRAFSVSPDGTRVLFIRSASGTSPTGELWAYDVGTGEERLLADPVALLGDAGEELSAAERSRRERSREIGAGVVSFSTDATGARAAFALSGRLWVVDVDSAEVRELPVAGGVLDPRLDPTGHSVAYVSGGALHVVGTDGSDDRVLAEPDGDEVTWGLAEFVAAEEMDRHRGYWWSPDGQSLLVERCDNAPVAVWYIADPANPDRAPAPQRYPAAGTANADVSLWHVDLAGSRTQVRWDADAFPYLLRVAWGSGGPPLVAVMSRDQRRMQILSADPASGETELLREDVDDAWLDAVVGVPAWSAAGRLVTTVFDEDTCKVALDGKPLGPAGLHVRSVVAVEDDAVVVSASREPTELHLVRVRSDGSVEDLTSGAGVHTGAVGGATTVVARGRLDADGVDVVVLRDGAETGHIESRAVVPPFRPTVQMLSVGERDLRTAVLFPTGYQPGSGALPVLMDPYGGPHGQMVVAASRAFLAAQWFADQGFAVIVADGRGTPGRGHDWDRAVLNDFGVTLDDQVDALLGVSERYPDDLDLSRVAMRGWSYGGYLAAMAVLRRPDVFKAAIAGAPVTDLALYDTFYTERYLGHPDEQPDVYAANSLLEDVSGLEAPLLIIHGLADDNVVAAHSLRLSAALLAAGKPHSVLPLSGVTHMTPQETVAENLLLLQVRFLRDALGC
ncbi:MAG TPA: prolyl oligopeptidase family serine peptidase [Nocardioidaceae bacterium]|nr:prolyl oligopeptidase family serine peptidase [Nocardioidaceae bacterium]